MIGRRLGHYRIVSEIGAGGMGIVYRARDEHLERDVAVKVLPAGTLADESARGRFRKEALALSRLNHANIGMVFDFDTQDGVDFLVLEFVDGESLDAKLAAGPLPEREVMRLGAQLAHGLAAAHAKGVIHRDLKPANLRMTKDGVLKILDFGLAALRAADAPAGSPGGTTTATATLATTTEGWGTLPYMPPEQLRFEPTDARSDVYAAGAVLYEMATGKRAFAGTRVPLLVEAILHQEPAAPRTLRPQLSLAMEAVIQKALEKDPERRYQTAVELGVDLQRMLTPTTPGTVHRERRRRPPRRWIAVAAVMLLASAGLGLWRGRSLLGIGTDRVEALAVLPLENLSHDADQEFFADGMTEQLINNLAQVSALKVISRTSIMTYKNVRKPLREVAEELGVDAIVEGSILRAGDRVRVAAQLVHARTDRHLWAQTYDRDLQDILTLQSEVARAIVDEIRVHLTAREQSHLADSRQVNPRALDAYLRARFLADRQTEVDLRQSVASCELAIAIDPEYAEAHAGLAQAWWALSTAYVPPAEAMPKARAAAERALAIDPTLAEAYTALASVKAYYDWRWSEAEADFRRAVELKPSDAEAHMLYGYYLSIVRRFDEASEMLQRARELDPLSFRARIVSLFPLYEGRRYEAAVAGARALLESHPNHPNVLMILGQASLALGRHGDAIAALEQAVADKDGRNVLPVLGCAYAAAGQPERARAVLADLLQQPVSSEYGLVILYAALDDMDQAIDYLGRTIDARAEDVLYLASDTLIDPLRSDPRFPALLQRLGLPAE